MADKTDWVVDGFQFGTEKDAELAKNEKLRIERLEEKLDYNKPQMIEAVYNKAIGNRVFKTPVGYEFLKRLQTILKETFAEGEVADIPVCGVYSLRESANPVIEKVKASQKKKKEKTKHEFFDRRTSILVNIGLVLLVIIMFIISTTSSNPTVLNYEKVIQNRYSAWEAELDNREQAVREKERELLLSE
ncbi:MAG: hypothetical protein J6D08_05295 [Lachnospiraceae bacterium]|nr:hypothetical protein [Lachnospiraceae bacterium]